MASSGLPVTYESSTPTVCTISGATVTMASVGTCTVVASQGGNSEWEAAPDVSQSITFSSNASWSGPMTGMAGNVSVAFSGGSSTCTIDPAQTGFAPPTTQMQAALQVQHAGASLPNGAFSFRATGCAGDTLTVTLTYPEPVAAGAQFLKWGPSASGQRPAEQLVQPWCTGVR